MQDFEDLWKARSSPEAISDAHFVDAESEPVEFQPAIDILQNLLLDLLPV